MSGQLIDASDDDKLTTFSSILQKGPIIELLEPTAREFNNIPQSKATENRINCAANDGSFKSHFVVQQGSRSFF